MAWSERRVVVVGSSKEVVTATASFSRLSRAARRRGGRSRVCYKLQVTSYKLQATSYKLQAASCKLQATSYELQATSHTLQATSHKPQATSCKSHVKRGLRPSAGYHHIASRNSNAQMRAASDCRLAANTSTSLAPVSYTHLTLPTILLV